MTNKPICPGTGRAVPGHSRYERADDFVSCPECGNRLRLVAGLVPKHRLRAKPRDPITMCMVPGCDKPRLGVCAEHAEAES